MKKKLKRIFFLRPTLEVAKNLLGKYIIHRIGKCQIVGKIVEAEAYIGPKDKASHGYLGKRTPRNQAEYLIGGHIYIYLVYGMYWQLNISTGSEGKPECVLIRALEPTLKKNKRVCLLAKEHKNLANGPGKLCRYLKLNGSHYGLDVTKNKQVWLEDRGDKVKSNQIVATRRIGIDYAGPYWASRRWRFYIKDNHFISKK